MHHAPLTTTPASRELLNESLQALNLARKSGQAWAVAEAHLGLARWYRDAGEPGFALSLLETGLAASPGLDQRVELLCECVNVLAQQSAHAEANATGSGRRARQLARRHVQTVSGLSPHLADPQWEATVLLHLSDVLDRFGDRADATRLQSRALQLMGQQSSDNAVPPFNPHVMPGLGRLADG